MQYWDTGIPKYRENGVGSRDICGIMKNPLFIIAVHHT